jgi:DNA replication protein DnaC
MAQAQLAIIPPVFNNPRLSRLSPRADLHPGQAAAITFIRANPNDSYLFVGKNGTGKSHIAWALYRYAVSQRRPVVACTVRDLLADFRRVEVGVPEGETLKAPRVTADELRKSSKPWLLFLDEFEKARPSEFASEQLFNVIDAARSFQHQIVVTSNFSAEALRTHWGRIDEIWGNSIMTRLQECHEVDFF